jgi:hypothetical protein
MDFFNTKEIKFNTVSSQTPKMSNKPGGLQEMLFLLQEKKELAITAVIVLGSVFFLFSFTGEKNGIISGLDQKIADYSQKEAPLKEYQKTQKENKDFFTTAPMALSEGNFINEIATLASKRNIKILSYVPVSPTVAGFYQKINVNMNCAADSFQEAMLFLKDVESSPFSIRIDAWSAGIDPRAQSDVNKPSETIAMQITFSSIHLNERNAKKDKNK